MSSSLPVFSDTHAIQVERKRPDRRFLLVALAGVLATIPVWVSTYPPMVDLPQHAAQIALLHNLHDPSFRFADLFWINWFTPYLLGYLVIYAITPVLGIVSAAKLVVSLALLGIPICTALLMFETGADVYWALLTIPSVYGFSYSWGFVNFIVAAPLGLLFLALVMRQVRRPSLHRSFWLAMLAVLLFFSHALICIFFGMIALAYIAAETGNLRHTIRLCAPIATPLPIMLLWYLKTKSNALAQEAVVWDLGWMSSPNAIALGGRITGFFPRLLGLEPRPMCLGLGVLLFVLPFLAGARPVKRLAVWIPLAICVSTLLFAPTKVFSGWAVAYRFTIFVLPFFVLGLRQSGVVRPLWRAATLLLLVAWLAITTRTTLHYNAEARSFNRILSSMEPNQRALSLMYIPDTNLFSAPVFLHYPAWYSATRQGVVDMNFALWPVELVRYRPADTPPIGIGFEWHPQRFRWTESGGSSYRYFVVHAEGEVGSLVFAWAPCRVSLAAQAGNWWLYEKDPGCSLAQ